MPELEAAKQTNGAAKPVKPNGHITMARQTTIESRLGRIEGALERAVEDRIENTNKLNLLDQKFDAILAANGGFDGSMKQLSQSLESLGRAVVKISDDQCGQRLKTIEGWMPQIEGRIRDLEPARALRPEDESRLADCVRGVNEYRKARLAVSRAAWRAAVAALGSGAIGGAIVKFFGH